MNAQIETAEEVNAKKTKLTKNVRSLGHAQPEGGKKVIHLLINQRRRVSEGPCPSGNLPSRLEGKF